MLSASSSKNCASQADLPALLLAHLPAGHPQLFSDDVRDQSRVLVRQHRPPAAAPALPPLQISHQQLGLHQPGSDFPPGTPRTHAATDIRRAVLSPASPSVVGAEVSAHAGREERPREVLEAAGAADGGQPPLVLSAHSVCQPAEEGGAVCARPRAAGRSG